MVEAWHARNVTMARRLAAALERGRPVVVIVGRGHQDAGGLPDQLAELRPGTRQLVVSMVEAPPDRESPAKDRIGANVVWLTPPIPRDDPCAPLRPKG
jgi:pheromone shutdown protein TraB